MQKLQANHMENIAPMLYMLNAVYPLNKTAENFIINHCQLVKVKKGEKLHKSGEICNTIYFVIKGAIRGCVKEANKDITTWITVENELVAAIYSFNLQIPSYENMEAIEDSDLMALSYTDMKNLYEIAPETNIMARRIYEKYYADAEIRALIARLSKAEKKYEFFLKTYSHLSNRIPLTFIASFLGINLETLSRIRGQKRIAFENIV